jgi:hypothetical protein
LRLVGFGFIGFASLITALNVHCSLIRPLSYKFKHRSWEGYKHVSGFPAVGTMFAVIGVLLAFGNTTVGILGLIITIADTGGPVWFLISTWKGWFWDE